MPPLERKEKPLEEKQPRCPHCGARPCQMFVKIVGFGPQLIAAVFSCGACEKVLSVAPVNPPEERPEPQPRREPMILVPGA
jgi:hypothetical protein